jgi:parvulin-like peptidyl-prolyl isomerase
MNNHVMGPAPVAQSSDVVSGDILAREPVANHAEVKHILIGWKDLEAAHDDRAAKRTKQEAEALVKSLLTQLKAGADFDMLAKQHSEDPGSTSGHAYPVSPDAQLVIEFKQLGLRLNVGEIGVVQSDYGFHIMKRVE